MCSYKCSCQHSHYITKVVLAGLAGMNAQFEHAGFHISVRQPNRYLQVLDGDVEKTAVA